MSHNHVNKSRNLTRCRINVCGCVSLHWCWIANSPCAVESSVRHRRSTDGILTDCNNHLSLETKRCAYLPKFGSNRNETRARGSSGDYHLSPRTCLTVVTPGGHAVVLTGSLLHGLNWINRATEFSHDCGWLYDWPLRGSHASCDRNMTISFMLPPFRCFLVVFWANALTTAS